MKKGDLKKQEILDTAEQLFARNGYEETSVQDILDVLHSSKGSFYHHYVSKDQLLEAMCVRRAEISAELMRQQLTENLTTIQAVNLILSSVMPFQEDRLGFLLMLLPVFAKPEGWSIRHRYCLALKKSFLPSLAETIEAGCRSGEMFCLHPGPTGDLCFTLVNDLWCRICDCFLEAEAAGSPAQPGDLLDILEQYRLAIVKMISAPYGSIELMKLADLKLLADQIHIHWKVKN